MHYSTQRRRKKIISIQKVDCVVVPLSSYLSSTSREKLKYIVPLFLRLSCITMKQWGCVTINKILPSSLLLPVLLLSPSFSLFRCVVVWRPPQFILILYSDTHTQILIPFATLLLLFRWLSSTISVQWANYIVCAPLVGPLVLQHLI